MQHSTYVGSPLYLLHKYACISSVFFCLKKEAQWHIAKKLFKLFLFSPFEFVFLLSVVTCHFMNVKLQVLPTTNPDPLHSICPMFPLLMLGGMMYFTSNKGEFLKPCNAMDRASNMNHSLWAQIALDQTHLNLG
jgi:hypothetical protein